MDVKLVRAGSKDAQLILEGQRKAFWPLLEKYQDGAADPANESIENIRKAIENEYFYLIFADETFAGALMIEKDPDTYHLKLHTVYVIPGFQNKGIAGEAIDMAESLHSEAVEWTLNTPADLENNRHLYEKKGYIKRGEKKINDLLTLSYYSKAGRAAHVYEATESRDVKQGVSFELHKGQRFSVGPKYEGNKGWDGWYHCVAESGNGWVPESIISFDAAEGNAKEDYSSFELSIKKVETLKGIKETGGWILCENGKGIRGWVPKECLRIIIEGGRKE